MSSKFTLHISVSILLHVCYICPRKKCENIQAYDSQLCYHIANTINYKIQPSLTWHPSDVLQHPEFTWKQWCWEILGAAIATHVEGTQLGKLA